MNTALRVLSALILAIMLALAAGYAWLRQSLPQLEGTVTLSGLKAPVDIVRDRYGVPSTPTAQRRLRWLPRHAQAAAAVISPGGVWL